MKIKGPTQLCFIKFCVDTWADSEYSRADFDLGQIHPLKQHVDTLAKQVMQMYDVRLEDVVYNFSDVNTAMLQAALFEAAVAFSGRETGDKAEYLLIKSFDEYDANGRKQTPLVDCLIERIFEE